MSADMQAPPEETGGAEQSGHHNPTAGDEPTRRFCPICCTGHATTETPYWLQDSPEDPAYWRFVFHVIAPLGRDWTYSLALDEKIDCARLFALVYGDRELARAIRTARTLPVPHGVRWDPLWDRIFNELHKRAVL